MVERRCIASGEIKPAEELIRFVCGPDGALVPDLARKAAWPWLLGVMPARYDRAGL